MVCPNNSHNLGDSQSENIMAYKADFDAVINSLSYLNLLSAFLAGQSILGQVNKMVADLNPNGGAILQRDVTQNEKDNIGFLQTNFGPDSFTSGPDSLGFHIGNISAKVNFGTEKDLELAFQMLQTKWSDSISDFNGIYASGVPADTYRKLSAEIMKTGTYIERLKEEFILYAAKKQT